MIKRSALRTELSACLAAAGVSVGHIDLSAVWPAVERWMQVPVDDRAGRLLLECLALPSGVEREGYPSSPPGLPVGTVYVLEVSREAEGGPSVGVALHYGEDADWKALMRRDDVRVDHPFVYECWADDDGAPDEFLRTVESSSFFQIAGSKSSLLTTVFDFDHECPLRFERDG